MKKTPEKMGRNSVAQCERKKEKKRRSKHSRKSGKQLLRVAKNETY